MHSTILQAFLLVGGVAAIPLAERASSNPCSGGREYCGWFDKSKDIAPECKCCSGQSWSGKSQSCTFPPIPKPSCGSNQKAVCAENSKNYCDYDENNSLCQDDGNHVCIVVDTNIEATELQNQINTACGQPNCPSGQSWDSTANACRWPCFPESQAQSCSNQGGRPVCAQDPSDYCDYDQNNAYCEDNGVNSLQCLQSSGNVGNALNSCYSPLNTAVSTLGYNCLNTYSGCSSSSSIWSLLTDVEVSAATLVLEILGGGGSSSCGCSSSSAGYTYSTSTNDYSSSSSSSYGGGSSSSYGGGSSNSYGAGSSSSYGAGSSSSYAGEGSSSSSGLGLLSELGNLLGGGSSSSSGSGAGSVSTTVSGDGGESSSTFSIGE